MKKIIFLLYTLGLPASAAETTTFDSEGNEISKAVFTPFLSLHGFDKAHQAGFCGEGQSVIFFESGGVDPQHPIFEKAKEIAQYDVGRGSKVSGEDKSSFRYMEEEYRLYLDNIDIDSSPEHGNHVIGMAVGQPISIEKKGNPIFEGNGKYCFVFSGGAMPKGQAINITYSNIYLTKAIWEPIDGYSSIGRAYYSVGDAFNNAKWHYQMGAFDWDNNMCHGKLMTQGDIDWYNNKQRSRQEFKEKFEKIQPLHKERLEKPADDSLLDAFKFAGNLDGVAINISAILAGFCDPLNSFLITNEFLDEIGEILEKKDKILILSANNNYNKNLSTFNMQPYFKQFSAHPKIGPRLLIGVNVITSIEAPVVQLPNGLITGVKLFESSNYPGEDLKEYAVSAFGSNILSGWQSDGAKLFEGHSGTSQSAPLIASLCALWKQKCPEFSGTDIVKKIKETAILLPDEAIFGKGLINAWALASDQCGALNQKPIDDIQEYFSKPFSHQLIIAMVKQHPHLTTYTSKEIRALLDKAENATTFKFLLDDEKTRQVLLDQQNIKDELGETILHHAARAGRADIIKVWLENDQACEMLLKKNIKNRNGLTPLHIAASTGKTEVVKAFLENDYARNILFENIKDDLVKTPFYLAIFEGFKGSKDRFDVVGAFLKYPEAQSIQKLMQNLPCLHWATHNLNGTNIIKGLLESDETRRIFLSQENIKDKNGNTVLHYAVNRNKEEIVKAIIENSAAMEILLAPEHIGNEQQVKILKEKLASWNLLTHEIELALTSI